MLCGALGIGPAQLMLPRGPVRSMGAASRPYSINAAVWLAFVAVNGVCMHCGNLFLKIQETRHAIVSVSFGSLMVHRQQWDTYWGAKKFNFLIRDIDDATRAGASAESCRFVVLRCPGGRLGSVVDVRNRLRRMRGRSHRCIHIGKVLCALLLWTMVYQRFRSRAL